EVIEVLAQPDGVVRVRGGAHEVRGTEARYGERGDGLLPGFAEQLGKPCIPRRERARALAERVTDGIAAGGVAGQARDRVGGEAQAHGAAHEAPELLLFDVLRSLLGDECTQGVIE